MGEQTKEFQKNELVTVEITDIGTGGEGIGKIGGFPLFVKDAVPGDKVEARITKNKKSYAYARLEKVIAPSPFRVEPKCACHRQCGGCQLQTYEYRKQLEFKQNKIFDDLVRIGGFSPEETEARMEPIVGMEDPFHYRNKAQYPVGTDKSGRVITGFYAGRTHTIIPNTDCRLGAPENQEILRVILRHMQEHHIPAYDETSGRGLVRHILIRKGFTSKELMVCLIIRSDGRRGGEYIPAQKELLEKLTAIPNMTSVSVNINNEKTNVIMGKKVCTIWGESAISDTIHVRDMRSEGFPFTGEALDFKISPLSFYQVNPVQTEKLYSLALEYAGLTGRETVWDLYCGIGTISLFLAGHARRVCGIEIVEQAISDARENARRNGIENAVFYVGKVEDIRQKTESDMCRPDVIVVDPPRKGCDEACLRVMLEARPERIVYVSCDPATLARDLKILCAGGYELKRIRGVDQFGMTVHVECVCLLVNHKKSDTQVKFSLNMEEILQG